MLEYGFIFNIAQDYKLNFFCIDERIYCIKMLEVK